MITDYYIVRWNNSKKGLYMAKCTLNTIVYTMSHIALFSIHLTLYDCKKCILSVHQLFTKVYTKVYIRIFTIFGGIL